MLSTKLLSYRSRLQPLYSGMSMVTTICNPKTTRTFNMDKVSIVSSYRCYLSQNHNFRSEKDSFDGTTEKISPPKVNSCNEILNLLQDLEGLHLSKDPKIRKKKYMNLNR
uniref:Uncharacterized protein n=1 Tax=Solanum lycopersicum TaxID=4081 RepID=A0A3Q7JBF8_SOLLC